jgi:hypothetical protein
VFKSDAEFDGAMESLDARYAKSGLDLSWRPVHAHIEMENLLGHDLPFGQAALTPNPSGFEGADLAARVSHWFRARYGDQLDEDLGPGRVAFRLRGGRWAFRLPGFIVETQMLVRAGAGDSELPKELEGQEYADIDIFDYAENGPSNIALSLTSTERDELVSTFLLGYEALARLKQWDEETLIAHALADNDTCVFHLTAPSPAAGLAKWSALQATEKALKGYLQLRTKSFPHGHDLTKVANAAIAQGLSSAMLAWLKEIQCSAGVRYGETMVSQNDAFAAHYASLRVLRTVGEALGSP